MSSAAIRAGCRHAEAFCLMLYVGDKGGSRETFWNARDGVTPFGGCPSRDGADELTHHDFAGDRFAPFHRPKAGARIFVSQTRAGAEARRRAWLTERWAGETEHDALLRERFSSVEEAVRALDQWMPGAPALSAVDPELRLGPWFDGERWRACAPGVGEQVLRGRVVVGLRELSPGAGFLDHDHALRAYCEATGEPAPEFYPRPRPAPARFA